MIKGMKLDIKLSPKSTERYERLRKLTEAKSAAEIVKNALRLEEVMVDGECAGSAYTQHGNDGSTAPFVPYSKEEDQKPSLLSVVLGKSGNISVELPPNSADRFRRLQKLTGSSSPADLVEKSFERYEKLIDCNMVGTKLTEHRKDGSTVPFDPFHG